MIQDIGIKQIPNARELGGYPLSGGRHIKYGSILRTGALHNASTEDIGRLVDVYRVSLIVDFHSPEEIGDLVLNIHILCKCEISFSLRRTTYFRL